MCQPKIFSFFMLMAISFYLPAQDVMDINTWKKYHTPPPEDSLRSFSGTSKHTYTIRKDNDRILVEREDYSRVDTVPFNLVPADGREEIEMRGRYVYEKVEDGYLVGFNRGEWGGSVFWFSNDGKKHYHISNNQLNRFIRKNNRLYAIHGLAHLSPPYYGGMVYYEKKDGYWEEVKFVDLKDAPEAIDIDLSGNFIIMTALKLVKVDNEKNVTTLIEEGFWPGLYPTSMVIDKQVAFFAMRGGVFKYNLDSGEQEWLSPY